jgi:2-oxo-4-hydroxy-4-carboxy--5-ureidoimidazoline (OHCU) decarboxylase
MKPYAQMDQNERATWNHRAAQTMEKMGGGFAAALALAYYRADGSNQAAILAAFPDLFEKYRRIAYELQPDQAET